MKKNVQKMLRHVGYELRRLKPQDDTEIYVQEYGKESVKKRRFYNICGGGHLGFGGGFYHPCWTNVDLDRKRKGPKKHDPEKDITCDLFSRDPLPIESDSAELVHSRFTIEHITDEDAENLFKEVIRILKQDGVFKIVVPNIDLDYRAYIKRDRSYFNWLNIYTQPKDYEFMGFNIPPKDASLEQIFLIHFAANASIIHKESALEKITDSKFIDLFQKLPYQEALNYCTAACSVEVQKKYRQNHINWWNHDKLQKMLSNAGFKTVYPLLPNQSSTQVMRNPDFFDSLWNHVALIMEAIK